MYGGTFQQIMNTKYGWKYPEEEKSIFMFKYADYDNTHQLNHNELQAYENYLEYYQWEDDQERAFVQSMIERANVTEIEENASKFRPWERKQLKAKLDRIGIKTSITQDPYSITTDKYHSSSDDNMSTEAIVVTIVIVLTVFIVLACLAYLYLKDDESDGPTDGPHNNWGNHPARSVEEQNARNAADDIYRRQRRQEEAKMGAGARGNGLQDVAGGDQGSNGNR